MEYWRRGQTNGRTNRGSVVGMGNVKDSTNSCEGIKFMDRLDIKPERMAISKNNAHISDLGNLEDDDANY